MKPSNETQFARRRWECRQSLTLALVICLLLSAVSAASLNRVDAYKPMSTLEFESQLWEHQRILEQKVEDDIQSMPDLGQNVPLPPEAAILLRDGDQNRKTVDSSKSDLQSAKDDATLPVQLIDESYRLVTTGVPSSTDAGNTIVIDGGSESVWVDSTVPSAVNISRSMFPPGAQSKGPSAITLLVGIAAAVVVIGALFSGRD